MGHQLMFLAFVVFGSIPVSSLRLNYMNGNTHAPPTKIIDNVVEGPWNNLQDKCQADKLVDVGFDPLKFCRNGWELLQSQHQGRQCIAYDIGVRDQADFALAMIEKFGCQVRAYDPCQTTAEWWEQQNDDVAALHRYANKSQYKLWKQAAGGTDGDLKLYEYNWQQLGTFRASLETKGEQKEFIVQSKTLQSMMQDNNDNYIDVLKVDIEGSEFAFLNQAFDTMGCPPVEHMLLEWHSQDLDMEYGAPPQVKEVEDKMHKCGYKRYNHYAFFVRENATSEEKFDIGPTYYGHAAYCKKCAVPINKP